MAPGLSESVLCCQDDGADVREWISGRRQRDGDSGMGRACGKTNVGCQGWQHSASVSSFFPLGVTSNKLVTWQ